VTFTSFAQNFEDVLLWRALSDVRNGRYIDIGAHDPEIDSVSFAFYKAGWRGLHVEPVPSYAERLREARPEEAVIQAAVTDQPGPILFYELSGLSSGRKEIAEHHARSGAVPRQMFVPTVGLDQLLLKVDDEIHWLKVDVEGMEADVLRSWGECAVRPWVLVIEATFPNSPELTHDLWIHEVVSRGYSEVFFDGLSRYFLHEDHPELAGRFLAPANVFDGFTVTADHFSAKGLLADLQDHQGRLSDEIALVARLSDELGASGQELSAEKVNVQRLNAERDKLTAQLRDARRDWETAKHDQERLSRELLFAERMAHQEQVRLHQSLLASERTRREVQETGFAVQQGLRDTIVEQRAEIVLLLERNTILQGTADQALEADLASKQANSDLALQLNAAEHRLQSAVEFTNRLHHELELLRGLANAVVHTIPSRWQRIGEALGFSRRPDGLKMLDRWLASSPPTTLAEPSEAQFLSEGSSIQMHNPTSANGRNPYLRADSLDELLSWQDIDFVRCGYVTILGRQPDAEGEKYYTNRIRGGHSKLKIMRQLRKSKEGRAHDPGIAGLDRALNRAYRAQRPIWGPVYRFFAGVPTDDSREQLALLRTGQRRMAGFEDALAKVDRTVTEMALRLGSSHIAQASDGHSDHLQVHQLGLERSLADPIDMSWAANATEIVSCLSTAVNSSREVTLLAQRQ